MMILNEIIAGIIAYLGLFIGILLAYFSSEELKNSKKYFIIAKRILFVSLSLILLFHFLGQNYIVFLIAIIISIVFLLVYRFETSKICYGIIAMFLVLTSANKNIYYLISSFTFLYGMLLAGIYMEPYVKKDKIVIKKTTAIFKVLKRTWFFPVIFLGLYVLRFFLI